MSRDTGDYSASAKLKLMRIDLDLLEILRRTEDVPSEYVLGRRMLDEARPLVRTDLKKAVKLTSKAKKLFLAESVPAGEYNRMEGDILAISTVIPGLVSEYRSCLAEGDFKGASEVLREIRERPVYADCLRNLMFSAADEGPIGEYGVTVSNRTPSDSVFVSAFGETDSGRVDMRLTSGETGVRSKNSVSIRLESAGRVPVRSITLNYRSNGTDSSMKIAVRGVRND